MPQNGLAIAQCADFGLSDAIQKFLRSDTRVSTEQTRMIERKHTACLAHHFTCAFSTGAPTVVATGHQVNCASDAQQ